MDLRNDYPLVPRYPEYGDRWLLVWWTEDEQHHVAISSTEKGIDRIWSTIIKSKPYAEGKALWKVTIVAPPLDYQHKYAQDAFESEEDQFHWRVYSLLSDHQEHSPETVPEGFRPCETYESKYEDADESDAQDHSSCVHCSGWKMLPISMTMTEFFLAARDEFRGWSFGPDDEPEPVQVPDDATQAVEGSPVYAAFLDGGHHHNGVTFMDVAEVQGHGELPLFFFQGKEMPLPQCVHDSKQAHAEGRDEAAIQQKAEMAANRLAHEEESARRLKALIGVFQ